MALYTELEHIESEQQHSKYLEENENLMVCCGRMGPMCIPVYSAMIDLQKQYSNIKFADMEFDIPDAAIIRSLPECSQFMGLPFTVYYKNGKVVKATTSIQSIDQIKDILDSVF